MRILCVFLVVIGYAIFAEETREVELSKKDKQTVITIPGDLKFGAFTDLYYLYNSNKPANRDTQYLTQPARSNEFNVNLAYVDMKYDSENIRGRLALQYGNSVNANYANERTDTKNSNQVSVRNIQEAYVGYQVMKNLWIDAGIYFGNIGLESWISRNNWIYTRALALENVPYYSSGIRISYKFSEKLSAQLHIMNGWSIITDNNKDKALGTQIVYDIIKHLKLTHNTFVGNEVPDGQPKQTRYYNNLILQYDFTDRFSMAGSMDVGIQRKAERNAYKQWYIGTLWFRYKLTDHWRIGARLERMLDTHQVVEVTSTQNGFQVSSATLNFDFEASEIFIFRMEGRTFKSLDPIFYYGDNSYSRGEKFLVCSLAMKI